jgi:hypothetical protein
MIQNSICVVAWLNSVGKKCLVRTNLVRGNPAGAKALVHLAVFIGPAEAVPLLQSPFEEGVAKL